MCNFLIILQFIPRWAPTIRVPWAVALIFIAADKEFANCHLTVYSGKIRSIRQFLKLSLSFLPPPINIIAIVPVMMIKRDKIKLFNETTNIWNANEMVDRFLLFCEFDPLNVSMGVNHCNFMMNVEMKKDLFHNYFGYQKKKGWHWIECVPFFIVKC